MIEQANKSTNKVGITLAILAILGVALLIYFNVTQKEKPTREELYMRAIVENFDDRLLACNQVFRPDESEAFNTCKAAADDGRVSAQKRMAWIYAQDGEHQNMRSAFDWLMSIKYRDDEVQLLLYMLVNMLAESETLKQDGEKGIQRMANKNYAPANVLLACLYGLDQNMLPRTSSPVWLLKRAHEQALEIVDSNTLALVYANGYFSAPNDKKAAEVLYNTVDNKRGFPIETNNIAWFLSTFGGDPITERDYAVKVALQVTEDENHASNPVYLDTLAASYASNSMFDLAVSTQQKAIDLLENSEWDATYKENERNKYLTRLSKYENKQALVETYLPEDKQQFLKSLRARVINYLFSQLSREIVKPSLPDVPQE